MPRTGHKDDGPSKPVAEVWYAIDVHDNDIIRFREDHIDSFAVGDIWPEPARR